jgi:hypothetical protein
MRGRCGCGRCAARHHRVDALEQPGGVDGVAAAGLVAGQLAPQRVAGGQQHVDHRRGGLQLVAAQPVEQRFHAVRQLGHVGEAERRGAALDRVRAAEHRVQRLVVRMLDVQPEQQLLHTVEVLARLLEEDLVELAQVEAGRRLAAAGRRVLAHCGVGSRISGSPCR